MTDPTKPDDEEFQPATPSSEGSNSSTHLEDIHFASSAETPEENVPPDATFVPLSSTTELQTPDPETPPVETLEAASVEANPFDAVPRRDESIEETLVESERSGGVDMSPSFHAFTPPPSDSTSASAAAPLTTVPPPRSQLNALVLTWASLATLTAIYLWWTRPDYPSNLDTIPDDGVLTSMLSHKKNLSPLTPLDSRLTIALNQTRRFGNLEVTPLGVEHRRVKVLTSDGDVAYEPYVLALKLKVQNVGADRAFAPSDPAFTSLKDRGVNSRTRQPIRVKGKIVFEDGYTYTFAHPIGDVESIDKRILPLPIEYAKKESVAEQEFPSLQPGESADVLLLSQEDSLPKLKGPMIWRVKLRKGRNSTGTGAAVVVGIPFSKDDVVMTAPPPESRVEG